MKKIRFFLSEKFQFLEVEYSIYLNRCGFVMDELPYVSNLKRCLCGSACV